MKEKSDISKELYPFTKKFFLENFCQVCDSLVSVDVDIQKSETRMKKYILFHEKAKMQKKHGYGVTSP